MNSEVRDASGLTALDSDIEDARKRIAEGLPPKDPMRNLLAPVLHPFEFRKTADQGQYWYQEPNDMGVTSIDFEQKSPQKCGKFSPWECPKCGSVWAWHVPGCHKCNRGGDVRKSDRPIGNPLDD